MKLALGNSIRIFQDDQSVLGVARLGLSVIFFLYKGRQKQKTILQPPLNARFYPWIIYRDPHRPRT